VDWNATVYLNGEVLGGHLGGYGRFSFDLAQRLKLAANELIVGVFDPSESGYQPAGKQHTAAIGQPGSDVYTPTSGIWQTVWFEKVPAQYIEKVDLRGDAKNLYLTAFTGNNNNGQQPPGVIAIKVTFENKTVAAATGSNFKEIIVPIPNPQLWHPDAPNLYNVSVELRDPGAATLVQHQRRPQYTPMDKVLCYFGMREPAVMTRLDTSSGRTDAVFALNGAPLYLSGWLDQSYWPDGEYTAPTDEALASDLLAVKAFGFNAVRLHQKINPDRWYYHADRIGVVVLQDHVQKYGGETIDTVDSFLADMKAAVDDLYSYPSIVQWTIFNEDDMWKYFDVPSVSAWLAGYDTHRLIDTMSGPDGRTAMNFKDNGNVTDGHSYPGPLAPGKLAAAPGGVGKYGMIGEFGGVAICINGHRWSDACSSAFHSNSVGANASQAADIFVNGMIPKLQGFSKSASGNDALVSASIYTQITDVESECDGFLNMDRTAKFSDADVASIKAANAALIKSASYKSDDGLITLHWSRAGGDLAPNTPIKLDDDSGPVRSSYTKHPHTDCEANGCRTSMRVGQCGSAPAYPTMTPCNISALERLCDGTAGCAAFNSNGWFQANVDPSSSEIVVPSKIL
jgi:hypothetical protein